MSEAFQAWQRFAETEERVDVGRIVSNWTTTDLAPRSGGRLRRTFP